MKKNSNTELDTSQSGPVSIKRTKEHEYATPLIGVRHSGIPSNVASEGTFLVKNVRARFGHRKTIAAHEKQVIMQEEAQSCASL